MKNKTNLEVLAELVSRVLTKQFSIIEFTRFNDKECLHYGFLIKKLPSKNRRKQSF